MKRSRTHQIETETENIFRNFIPSQWAISQLHPDYGKDFHIEVFENEESTGKVFYVQLKGSDQKIENDTIIIKSLKNSYIEYFHKLPIPALFVFISTKTKQIWGIWANNLISAVKSEKYSQVKLNADYLLKDLKFVDGLSDSDKLGITVITQNENHILIQKKFNDWVEKFYSKRVSTNFNFLPSHLIFRYTDEGNETILSIETPQGQTQVSIKDLNENNSYLYQPYFDENLINATNHDFLFRLSIGLIRLDVKSSLKILQKLLKHPDSNISKLLTENDSLIISLLIHESIRQDSIHYLEDFIKTIIEQQFYNLFAKTDVLLFAFHDSLSDYDSFKIRILQFAASKFKNPKGELFYNLGNVIRNEDNHTGFQNYFLAKKYNSEYLDRYYWWQECAGILFEMKHYKFAEGFYKKAMQLQKKSSKFSNRFQQNLEEKFIDITPLIGDCSFFQGKFKDASKWFKKHLSQHKNGLAEWVLKMNISNFLNDNKLSDLPIKINESENYLNKLHLEKEIGKQNQICQKAIFLNPLNVNAWFNFGVLYQTIGKQEHSFHPFLMASLINKFDTESLFNALFLSMILNKVNYLTSITKYCLEKHGDNFINMFTEHLFSKIDNAPLEIKKKIIEAIKILSENIQSKE